MILQTGKKEKGFTFIEMIIVVVILSLILTITINNMQRYDKSMNRKLILKGVEEKFQYFKDKAIIEKKDIEIKDIRELISEKKIISVKWDENNMNFNNESDNGSNKIIFNKYGKVLGENVEIKTSYGTLNIEIQEETGEVNVE
ncbi:type II secretion system protein [Haliovirga abyssi]|uniref:Prepilin-type N-terminal cleavage/methylation domain-containing protein n=1 Tax=Haliovirga abyssi TaxID=2996794 RepID=A0AAU9DWC1_9FUSO|nr:type II secretion system protein [Haliovirga abyssi]BDU51699.1 hypothetical protein HLVA_22680 [Haliovirga abyssi]